VRALLAIDPGNTESGWVVIDPTTSRPLAFAKSPNAELLEMLRGRYFPVRAAQAGASETAFDVDRVVIEMVASYGMPVGAEVFETCVWIGRYQQALVDEWSLDAALVYRQPVKLHHCHSTKATDANIRQALVDRFAKGLPNFGKGTKKAPGWFFGFGKDVWQAYALAVYAADTE
jgi:hypothetical protein